MNNQNKCTLVFLIQPASNIHEENKILLLKRKNDPAKDTYTGVGGHIESNESPKQCALRETFEETGLELNDIKILGYYNKINSYIGYRLIKNLSNKFKEDETIKTKEGILGLYDFGLLDDLEMTNESRNALEFILKRIKL